LSAGQTAQYRAGYEDMVNCSKRLGGVPSELLVASAAKSPERGVPPEVGNNQHERCYCRLKPAGRELFRYKGIFAGTESEWSRLVVHYRGNPLALKLVAAATQELFNGRIVEVLNQQKLVRPDDIRDLLQRQFDRLSEIGGNDLG